MEGSFSLALTILAVQRGFPLSWRSYLSFLPLGSLLGWSSIFSFESGGTFWDIQIKNVLGWNILRCSIVPWPSRQAGGENGEKLVSLRAESFCQTFSGQVQHFKHTIQCIQELSLLVFLYSCPCPSCSICEEWKFCEGSSPPLGFVLYTKEEEKFAFRLRIEKPLMNCFSCLRFVYS